MKTILYINTLRTIATLAVVFLVSFQNWRID